LRYRFKSCINSGPPIKNGPASAIFGFINVGEKSCNARSARNRKARKNKPGYCVTPFAAPAVHWDLCATALNLATTADHPLKTDQLQQFLDLSMLERKAVTQGAPGTARHAKISQLLRYTLCGPCGSL